LIKWLVDRAVKAGALRGWPVAKATTWSKEFNDKSK
jgi:hypothetical protein